MKSLLALKRKGYSGALANYKHILQEAAEYDIGDAPDLSQTFKSPVQNRGDDLLDENDHYAVVYNNSVGGTYEVFRKLNEQQVQNTLTRYGLPDNATAEVKNIALIKLYLFTVQNYCHSAKLLVDELRIELNKLRQCSGGRQNCKIAGSSRAGYSCL